MTSYPSSQRLGRHSLLSALATSVLLSLLSAGALRAQGGIISGAVTVGCSNSPIPGAMISLDTVEIGAVANVDGFFQVASIPPGTYAVTASMIGYEPLTIDVVVAHGENTPQNFGLALVGDPLCYRVDHTADGGTNSLRQAIEVTNGFSNGAPDSIRFALSEFPAVVRPGTTLPPITDAVIIDGDSQSSSTCGTEMLDRSLGVWLNGEEAGASARGLSLEAGSDGSAIQGLRIYGFQGEGIRLENSHGSTIRCNIIGDPLLRSPNGTGIFLHNATGHTIGGATPAEGNLVSGNTFDGVHFEAGADLNVVIGNYVGVDSTGRAAAANGSVGVGINQGAGNRIGGSLPGERNVISGNGLWGVELAGTPDLSGGSIAANVIYGNYIGVDVTGNLAVPNSRGLVVSGTQQVVGGPGPGERNVISGNAGEGIYINGPNNVVIGNYIGTSENGALPVSNAIGILVEGSSNTIGAIGGGNVISGNSSIGVMMQGMATDNVVMGNLIGTDAAGTGGGPLRPDGSYGLGNGSGFFNGYGILISGGAASNTVGGAGTGEGNVISANTRDGILVSGGATADNVILGNTIGLGVDGSTPIANALAGIRIEFSVPRTVVGGSAEGAGNVISANGEDGILITFGSFGTSVQGNRIGTDATGVFPRGNARSGVRLLAGANNNRIGSAASPNVIAFNGYEGIAIGSSAEFGTFSTIENDLRGNITFGNASLGIDLAVEDLPPGSAGGVTLNDDGDADAGPNNLLNFPTILSISVGSAGLGIEGAVEAADGTYEVEFYANRSCDATGYGEGGLILGSASVTVSGGIGPFSEHFPNPNPEFVLVTATATDSDGNTSEFSKCVAPPVQVAEGHVFEVFAEELAEPQGMAMDPAGNLYVAASGSGKIYKFDASGALTAPTPYASGFSRPIDVEWMSGRLFVSDLDYNGLFELSVSDVTTTIDASALSPLVSGLDGPTLITALPNETALLVSVVRGATSDRVVRIDLSGDPSVSDFVTFSSNANPQGAVTGADGQIYLNLQLAGNVVTVPSSGAPPFNGDALSVALSGLESPVGLAIGLDRKLLVATTTAVLSATPGSVPQPFLSGLSGDEFNNVIAAPRGQVFVADRAAGRILRVVLPAGQQLASDALTFSVNAGGSVTISDGSELTAVQNAFLQWETAAETTLDFTYAGETAVASASASDGVNLVTFRDTSFPFPPLVLAVAAKTIELGDTPETARIIDADIVFNPEFDRSTGFRLSTNGAANTFDVESIATHEAGHVLGLVHSGVADATMFFVLQPGTAARTLTADDRAWAGHLYPSSFFSTSLGSISGRIADGERPGDFVAGALVLATNTTTGDTFHAYTDVDGSYYIPGVIPGSYELGIQPLDGQVFGFPMVPGVVSRYLNAISTNRNFQEDRYNDDESADPSLDDPTAATAFPVTGGTTTSAIDLITNLDLTPPAVTAFSPANGAANVPVDIHELLVTFSEPVELSTIQFSLSPPGGPAVGGALTLINGGKTAVFTPTGQLTAETSYSATVAAGLEDRSPSGNPTSSPFSASFTTEPPDAASPTVVQVAPSTSNVVVTQNITAIFSESVQPASVTTASFTVTGPLGPVPGTVLVDPSLDNEVAVFDPDGPLAEDTQYTVSLSTAIQDPSGNPLASSFAQTFRTVPVTAFTASVSPVDNATAVSVSTPVLVDFSKPIDPSSLSAAAFSLRGPGGVSVPGSFELLLLDSRVVFRPSAPLAFGTVYTVLLTGSLTDLVGQSLPPLTTSFTTASAPTSPSIVSVSPPAATVGATITISGSGYDPNPANTSAVFTSAGGTISGTVLSSTLSRITTVVPESAETGPLFVTVNGTSSSNAFPFGVITFDPLLESAVARVTSESGSRDADITPDGTLGYVTNQTSNSVSIIDLVRTVSRGSIPVGTSPLKIAITPDGTRAYVTNFLSHTVSVIDLTTDTVVETIPVGLNPFGVAVSPDGAHVYVAELTAKGITVIDGDPSSGGYNRATARVSTESGNRDIAITPDGTLALVTGTAGVTIVDLDPTSPAYNSAIARVSSESGTRDAEITPDGTLGFVTVSDGSIIVIDINPTGSVPFQVIARTSSEAGANEIELSPDGTLLFATNKNEDVVAVFEIAVSSGGTPAAVVGERIVGASVTLTRIATIDLGGGFDPEGIVFSPTSGKAIVANSGSGDVSILDFSGQLSEADAIDAMGERLTELVRDGEMTSGQGKALQKHLDKAASKYADGDFKDVIRELKRFKKKVKAFSGQKDDDGNEDGNDEEEKDDGGKGRLDPILAAELIASADAVIVRLGGDPAEETEDALAAVQSLAEDVQQLVADGRLEKRWSRDLEKELESARKALEDKKRPDGGVAMHHLEKFSEAVDKLEEKGRISGDDAEALMDAAGEIIETLESDGFAKTGIPPELPTEYSFSQNYPNPFSASTTIPFSISVDAGDGVNVRLEVYDVLGRRIATLVDEQRRPGRYEVEWDGRTAGGVGVTSGIYLIRIEAGTLREVRKAIVVR